MSQQKADGWTVWADNILGHCKCPAGGIYGLDGSAWAEIEMTGDHMLNSSDVLAVKECIDTGNTSAKPIHVGGCKQIVPKVEKGDYIFGKHKNKSCIVAVRCKSCIVVAVGGEGSEPRNFLDGALKVATMLKDNNL